MEQPNFRRFLYAEKLFRCLSIASYPSDLDLSTGTPVIPMHNSLNFMPYLAEIEKKYGSIFLSQN